jgi:hypothetical protein
MMKEQLIRNVLHGMEGKIDCRQSKQLKEVLCRELARVAVAVTEQTDPSPQNTEENTFY